ncbi:hypothetical protein BV911_12445 [Pseudoruegeria sp. SK021]|nr:hypothetical protein BV911_12445 [Pseudoruegeria sp. SK021]
MVSLPHNPDSAIRFVTPNARHSGHDSATLASRASLYATARAQKPERWSVNPGGKLVHRNGRIT